MEGSNRITGIDIAGDTPWGTHLCMFYHTKEDMLDILVPYFKAGLENNEFCMWVTSDPLNEKGAEEAIRKEMPDYGQYLERGQIEIIPYDEWYLKGGSFELQRVLNDWIDKLNIAKDNGYDGIRLTGNTAWLEEKDWVDFAEYEAAIDNVIGDYQMIALCSYSLDKCGLSEVMDVVNNHQFALIKREGKWTMISSAERERVTKALKHTENIYHDLFEESIDPVYVTSREDKFTEINPAMLKLFGYTQEEMLKLNARKLYAHPEDRDRFQRQIEKDWFVKDYDMKLRKKDGTEIDCILTSNVRRSEKGDIWGYQGIIRDVTEHKRMERMLQEEKQRLEVTLRSTGDGVITTDLQGNVEIVNRVAEELTGWSYREAIGKKLQEVFNIIDERTRRPIRDPIEKVIKTSRVVGLINHAILISKDGTERIIADSGAPIRDDQGNLYGIVLVFRDISNLSMLEAEVRKIDKIEAVGTLAGGIAHDFNNLLTGIMGNISLAKRYIEPGGKAYARLDDAEKASVRARDLTQQLLTFARGGEPIRKAVSMGGLIMETTSFALRGSNVKPVFSIPDDLWVVEVDEGQINQVISNILINADQAMPDGGIINIVAKNTASKEAGALPLPKGNYIEISIEDHGIGISDEHLKRIFEPYFTTKQKGDGLGLATAYSIIKKHHGHISVQSKLGSGTTFHIYLPASRKAAPKKEEEGTQASFPGRGRILVMDDEEIVRELLSQGLTDVGYEVELTEDGAEAIERYTKAKESGQPFNAVIMDLTIPGGMGGKEAIKKLLEIDPDARVIVSSGYSTDPVMADYKEYGFSAIAAKPYRVEEVEKTLRSLPKRKK
ncbi:MEDS domain-containing protein [Chloroflexota bacterium]